MSSTRRPLGQGPDITIPVRDPRTRTAAEPAADGDWVERPVAAEAAATVTATGPFRRRPLGRRGT
ncbi:hypothetical protein [Streptomyces sp. NPDC047071]|uniref:hypothetical protein n=1 Tax=Streptomyces sp. NPDC047071 TaxID=3154808 RepID=UPI00345421F7